MGWDVERTVGADLDLDEVLAVYSSSGLGSRRPVNDRDRFANMVSQANLVVVCREGGQLLGIARSVSDFAYATYLSDIAVAGAHQRRGVGRALIRETLRAGAPAKLILLAAPDAAGYYPHLGFTRHESAWVLDPAFAGST